MSVLKSINELYEPKNEYTNKREEYIEYINTHKDNVKSVFKNLFIENDYFRNNHEIREAIAQLQYNKNIDRHDDSKFGDEEFEPYRIQFFPVNGEEKISDELFKKAVDHHHKNNKHHWNYWVDENGNPKEMDMIYIIELICDWQAMSIVKNNTIKSWYEDEKDKIIFAPNTRYIVESMIDIIMRVL